MAEATDNREETSEFKTLCALDCPAKQILLGFTKRKVLSDRSQIVRCRFE